MRRDEHLSDLKVAIHLITALEKKLALARKTLEKIANNNKPGWHDQGIALKALKAIDGEDV